MAAVHEHTLRLRASTSHVQLGCNGTYLALPHTRINVGVWSLQDITCKPLELEGHRKPVTALSFGHRAHSTLLCSCANDYVIVWNIERARASYDAGLQIRGQVIGTTLGSIQYCACSEDDQMVAVCVDRDVIILSSQREQILARLEGHIGRVNCAEFCPHYTATLVSCSDDRTFKIWDIDQASLLYQSTIISSSPFISMTMDPLMEAFTLGTTDGQIRIYDLKDGNGFRCLHHVDVQKLLNKIKNAIAVKKLEKQSSTETKGPVLISSRPSWQRGEAGLSSGQDVADEEEESEIGCSILHMLYTLKSSRAASVMSGRSKTPTPAHLSFLQDDSLVKELLEHAPTLVVVTSGAVVQINARTLELCSVVNLQDPVPSASILEENAKSLPITGSAILAQSIQNEQVFCALGAMFGNEVQVLRLMPPDGSDLNNLKTVLSTTNLEVSEREQSPATSSEDSEISATSVITVLSSTPVLANSPLKAELLLKPKETPTGRRGSLKLDKTKRTSSLGNLTKMDQPLVVHSQVKSSGYTASPRKTMFQPQTNKASQSPVKTRRKSQSVGIISTLTKEYPMNSKAPTQIKERLDVAERPTAINSVKFSPSGLSLGCALANTSAQVFKLPLTGKGLSFNGHNGSVTSFCWSNDNKWIVTASDDKTANLWSLSVPDPVMNFSFIKDNFGTDKEGGLKPSKENPIFNKSVRFAQFYYMDKFILLTSGNSFYLYKYHVDTSKSDIKRYLSNNRYKLVKEFQMDQAQQITAFSAVNSFYSYITLAAGSNKTVEVYDMNVGSSIRTMTDAHSRPVHTICQNQGSPYVTHPSTAYDLFLTAAANDCIKLWDLRSDRCVRRYEGHANRIYPCGLAISPCSRFIATGSEDRCAYIFDIRSGTYVHKLTGHTDTVGDVEYHPLYPQLVTASLDGRLRLFTEN